METDVGLRCPHMRWPFYMLIDISLRQLNLDIYRFKYWRNAYIATGVFHAVQDFPLIYINYILTTAW